MSHHDGGSPNQLHVRRFHQNADLEVYALAGEIDLCTVPALRRLVRDTEARQVLHVLLDLTEVTAISVAGARELAHASIFARATHRSLTLVVSTRGVCDTLAGSGFVDRLIIHESLADAIQEHGPGSSLVGRAAGVGLPFLTR